MPKIEASSQLNLESYEQSYSELSQSKVGSETTESSNSPVQLDEYRRLREIGKTTIELTNIAKNENNYGGDSEEDEANLPFSRLEKLYGSHKSVRKEIYKLKKDLPRSIIFHESDVLVDYLNQAGNYKILSKVEVENLYSLIRPGIEILKNNENIKNISADDEATLIAATIAHQTMMVSNLKLVISIAKKFNKFPDQLPLEDLVSEGNIGLFSAISRFDPDKGYKFSTYATWWIRLFVTRAIAQKTRIIKLPMKADEETRTLRIVTEELTKKLKRQPTNIELQEESGITNEKIAMYQIHGGHWLDSLDAPFEQGSNITLLETIEDNNTQFDIDETITKISDKHEVEKITNNPELRLTDTEKLLLKMRFGLEIDIPKNLIIEERNGRKISYQTILDHTPENGIFSLVQAGVELGCSNERVRIMQREILNRIKDYYNSRF
jgi:RNA polymerase nonessential primary-like sigma factor